MTIQDGPAQLLKRNSDEFNSPLLIEQPFKQARSSEEKDPVVPQSSPRLAAHRKGWDATNWDLDTQQPHGGQEWKGIANFVEDFSVTTNFFGPPSKAMAACGQALPEVEHYPPANFEPHLSELAQWLQPGDSKELVPRLMLGNGASEIIDLVTRIGAHEGAFVTRSEAQYKEYERAALAAGREKLRQGPRYKPVPPAMCGTIKQALVTAVQRHSSLESLSGPGCLIRLGDLPIICHLLTQLSHAGLDRAVILCGYQGAKIQQAVEENLSTEFRDKMRLEFVQLGDNWQKSHAASILEAKKYFKTGEFLLCMSDHIFDPMLIAKMSSVKFSAAEGAAKTPDEAFCLVESDTEGFQGLSSTAVKLKLDRSVASNESVQSIGRTMELSEADAIEAGIFACNCSLFGKLEALASERPYFALAEALTLYVGTGKLKPVHASGHRWFAVESKEQLSYAVSDGLKDIGVVREDRDWLSMGAFGPDGKPIKDKFAMLAVINPCNPTGDYLPIEEMKTYIKSTCGDGMTVLVDESMQPWYGANWREDSLVSQAAWIRQLYEERDIRVYIIHSWTKIWSCPGIRLGSLICPHPKLTAALKKHQCPWSLNVFALHFLSAAIKDSEYMERTWMMVPLLRQRTVDKLQAMFPSWKFKGERWLSWIWIDTKSTAVAAEAVKVCKKAGVPIRNGAMGYGLPSFIRVKVADQGKQDIFFEALRPLSFKGPCLL